MIKIMFVCHGNICRSPMAEFIFKRLISERGLEGEFCVCSSATSTEEIWRGVGNPVYPSLPSTKLPATAKGQYSFAARMSTNTICSSEWTAQISEICIQYSERVPADESLS